MKTQRNSFLLLALAIAICCGGVPRLAHAATAGYITGQQYFYNNQGNYCPNSRSCVDALYPQNQWHQYMPVNDSKIVLKDSAGNVIGTGVTYSGNFYIWWYSSNNATSGYYDWIIEHKDSRFRVANHDGFGYAKRSGNFPLINGTSSDFPQFIGSRSDGDAINPSPLANIYDGAWRTWNNSFQFVGYLSSNFMNVKIRCFANPGECDTSCGGGLDVLLDAGASTPYAYSARVAHELGHVASDQMSQQREANQCGKYGFDNQPGWSMTSPEYGCAQYEEAWATMIGDMGRYWENAQDSADICGYQTGVCTTMAEPSGSCTGYYENRWVQTAYKFLWDVYDNGQDNEWVSNWWAVFENHHNFLPGTANRQRDEWTTCSGYPICLPDWDGKGVFDYWWNLWDFMGIDADSAYYNNCSPPGD